MGIVLFLLLSALLYSLLDPATRLDADSVAVCLGLAAGLAITLAAFSIPVAVAYRRRAITFYLRALPGTLAIGLVCVLLTRLTDFHPGYLYGLIVAFVVLREVSDPVEGRAMAQATVAMAVAAVVAWLTLWGVKELFPGGGDTPVGIVGLETALATIVVAGIELLVFGMVPVRFLPGDKIRRWNLIAWAGLFLAGILGFLVVLMNPSSGYLADNARTPLATIVVLFATFAIGSITFWGYFRFRRVPSVQPPV